jgi:hypothetical protein
MSRTAEAIRPKNEILAEIRSYLTKIEHLETQEGLDAGIKNDLLGTYIVRVEKNVRRLRKHQ